MHNLHFCVVTATSGSEACDGVISAIGDWGTENNWRVAGGAVSEYGEIFKSGEGRWQPSDEDTIQKITETIKEAMIPEMTTEISDVLKELLNGKQRIEGGKVYLAKEYLKDIYAFNNCDPKSFNILYNSFKSGEYDEHGVTIFHDKSKPENSADFIKKTDSPKEDEERIWVVFIDMHS